MPRYLCPYCEANWREVFHNKYMQKKYGKYKKHCDSYACFRQHHREMTSKYNRQRRSIKLLGPTKKPAPPCPFPNCDRPRKRRRTVKQVKFYGSEYCNTCGKEECVKRWESSVRGVYRANKYGTGSMSSSS